MSDEARVWVNGELLVPDEARIPYDDHGLTVGDGVFETIKLDRGVPFARTRHLRRLEHSATTMGIALPPADELHRAIDAVCAHAPDAGGFLRITVTAGPGPLGSNRGDVTPTVVVAVRPGSIRIEPTTALLVPWTRNEKSAIAGVKSTSYAENVRALAAAEAAGATEALFANTIGLLCEGTGSNVFVAVRGKLLTPALSSGCLAGVTRELLLEHGIGTEAEFGTGELLSATEVFLTSTSREVQPVSAVFDTGGRRSEYPGSPGPLTRAARDTWVNEIATQPDP